MSGLIERLQERTTTTTETPRVLEITEPDADEVLEALGTETRRRAFRTLFENPKTPTELAEELDTSIQNVDYHLSNLEDTGLVEPVDTAYSEKGNEMTIYGPASDPLVFIGDGNRTDPVRQTLRNMVAGLGLLAGASILVQLGTELLVHSRLPTGTAGPAGRNGQVFPDGSAGWVLFDIIEPGLLFFMVALVVAGIVALSMQGD